MAPARLASMAAEQDTLPSDEAITGTVGREAFARAMVAVRSGHVHEVEFDPEHLLVTGRVKGTYRDGYTVQVWLAGDGSTCARQASADPALGSVQAARRPRPVGPCSAADSRFTWNGFGEREERRA